MNKKQIARFFANFGIQKGVEYKSLSLQRYLVVVNAAARWYGPNFAQYVADCFMPEGPAFVPGYEESCTKYSFSYPKEPFLKFKRQDEFPISLTRKEKAEINSLLAFEKGY